MTDDMTQAHRRDYERNARLSALRTAIADLHHADDFGPAEMSRHASALERWARAEVDHIVAVWN